MTSGSIPKDLSATNHYEVLGEIASGRMGRVYRVVDHSLGREAACKVPKESTDDLEASRRRFVKEAQITAQLQHPCIPPVFAINRQPDGRPFMILKLVKGRALDDLLLTEDLTAERGRLLVVFEQVCQAVAYAHAKGVVHRDLEPANVMIGAFGEVQVLDWGLSLVIPGKRPAPGAAEDARLGADFGNPAYMAPEQARSEATDFRADVFGLGGLLCHVLTGRPPFTGSDFAAVARKAAAGDVGDALTRLDRFGAEAELVALAKECLRPRPEDRPVNAGQVASTFVTARDAAWRRSR